jgi:hypothetical protein
MASPVYKRISNAQLHFHNKYRFQDYRNDTTSGHLAPIEELPGQNNGRHSRKYLTNGVLLVFVDILAGVESYLWSP